MFNSMNIILNLPERHGLQELFWKAPSANFKCTEESRNSYCYVIKIRVKEKVFTISSVQGYNVSSRSVVACLQHVLHRTLYLKLGLILFKQHLRATSFARHTKVTQSHLYYNCSFSVPGKYPPAYTCHPYSERIHPTHCVCVGRGKSIAMR